MTMKTLPSQATTTVRSTSATSRLRAWTRLEPLTLIARDLTESSGFPAGPASDSRWTMRGRHSTLILPRWASTRRTGAHTLLMLDQAGWHTFPGLKLGLADSRCSVGAAYNCYLDRAENSAVCSMEKLSSVAANVAKSEIPKSNGRCLLRIAYHFS